MDTTIIRPPTMREVYEKIQEQLKECEKREHECSVYEEKHNGYIEHHYAHPDRHLYEVLEEIFRPIEEGYATSISDFFNDLLKKNKDEKKQRKPGETDKGTN